MQFNYILYEYGLNGRRPKWNELSDYFMDKWMLVFTSNVGVNFSKLLSQNYYSIYNYFHPSAAAEGKQSLDLLILRGNLKVGFFRGISHITCLNTGNQIQHFFFLTIERITSGRPIVDIILHTLFSKYVNLAHEQIYLSM